MNKLEAIKELYKLKAIKQLTKAMFGITLTPRQVDIVRAVAFDEHPRTIICCPTRYGKSFCVSIGILIWIAFNSNKKIVIIAPTNEKTTIIRNHVANFVSLNQDLLNLLDIDRTGSDKIKKEVSKRRMTWKNGIEMRTLSAEGRGEQLMGFGADKVIVDEECDIDYEVYRSRITRMLGESSKSTYVGIGNPWHRDNQMWNHWIDLDWHKIHIDYKEAIKEGRISQEFIEEQSTQLTVREFQVLYEAEFPETSEDALIDWNWIEKSYTIKYDGSENKNEILIGVDVAEQGNDLSVVTIAKKDLILNKYSVIDIFAWGKTDLMPTVTKILPIIDKYQPNRITIDATGVGSGVYSRLDELKKEGRIKCDVKAFKGGNTSDNDKDKERYLNIKAESYWHLRSLFESGKIYIPRHRELISQLSKMKWQKTSSEKIRIRDPGTKEGDTSEEKSPDFSDSLNICVWHKGRGNYVPSFG